MPDVFTKSKRSEVMSRIRSRGNKATELELAKHFRANGITGWRRGGKLRFRKKLKAENLKAEGGQTRIIRPDFVFRGRKIAVFMDGDFWHGHPTRAKIPAARRGWWLAKIEGNKARDRVQNRLLRRNGWKVVRIWQHAVGAEACSPGAAQAAGGGSSCVILGSRR